MLSPFYLYALATLAVIVTSLLGSYFTKQGVDSEWYQCTKSSLTPPKIVFPIVWTVLYALIAFCFGYVMIKYPDKRELPLLFIFNLALQVVWCYMFFKEKSPSYSLLFITTLWMSIIVIMIKSQDKLVSCLMTPYIMWISFAIVLNSLVIAKSTQCDDL